ncbi:MAG TPA: ribonuclease Y [Candidatus Portnoybacteria bacterium]|uniref:Ribonuclease Y n=1 Tax=Candidatus Portnoybacteria bacterium CG02_land_8_20_14_3_00_45_8 TaxID=1974807 RepID=A0A2M7D5Y5_9BACT|nr:MAG: ribonuclease Y [Candidatus Portnoybacteria bacterium CG02_land_8_20_14_3_00_45_8]HCX28057.1 ribonuclease Y [Candidatus Portnoybacteria bacterium]
MEIDIFLIITGVIAVAMGSVIGYLARQSIAKKQVGSIEGKLEKMMEEAKHKSKEMLLQAQDKALRVLEEAKQEQKTREQQLSRMEDRVERQEKMMDQKSQDLDKQYAELADKANKVKEIKERLVEMEAQKAMELEKVAKLSREEAKEELLKQVEKEHEVTLLERIGKLERKGKEELEKKARDVLTFAMQRYAASQAAEITTSTVALPSDDLKGRIIGKEGRNIKTLEKLTGVEVIVDDTPGAIVISAFDPIRRQIAKLALEKLMADGRIQPARIEDAVEKAKEAVAEKILEAGNAAVYDTGVAGLDPKLIRILGRLSLRTSYGQNVLLHSLEVAHLASAIAAEIGADATLAKKAGLLHDIGKAVTHEVQGSHVEIGKMILQKFNMSEDVIKVMQSHHEEYPYESLEAVIVQVADQISGARPGARKDTLEAYLKRLEELEKIANSFEGIDKSYAIQAGREIRVFVHPDKISDLEARKLARQIADRIQQDLQYPGEIKVTVIRELRTIEYAK